MRPAPPRTARGRMRDVVSPINLPAVLAVALFARLLVAALTFHFHPPFPLSHYKYENIALARSLRDGHGYGSLFFSPSGPSAFMPPGYPLVIAAVIALFGFGREASSALMGLQIAMSVATLIPIMLLARRHFGQYTANLAAVVYAVALPVLTPPTIIWDTCLSALLMTLAVLLVPRLGSGKWTFFLAGACCALAGLINPALLPSLLILLALRIWRLRIRPWAAMAGFVICFAPWPIRNAFVMHAFIPLRTNFPYELYMGNHPGGDGDFPPEMSPMDNPNERAVFLRYGELGYMHHKGILAKQYIEAHPGRFALLCLKRVVRFWAGSASVHIPGSAFLTVLAIFGLMSAVRNRRLNSALIVPLLVFPLPYYVTHAEARFQAIIDPILIVLAAEAIRWLLGFQESTEKLAPTDTSTAGHHPAPSLSLRSPLNENVP